MDYVTNLVYERNKDREVLNIFDAKNIAEYIIKKQGYNVSEVLPRKVYQPEDVELPEVFNNIKGTFSNKDKKIYYFSDGILEYMYLHANETSKEYNFDGSIIELYNFYNLICIIHEIEHARVNTIIDKDKSCIEKTFFKVFKDINLDNPLYELCYSNLPTEVNADNVGFITALNIYNRFPKNFISMDDKMKYQLLTLQNLIFPNYLVNFFNEEVYSPSEKIVDTLGAGFELFTNTTITDYSKILTNIDNLTIYKKIMLGLPLTFSEYSYCNLLIDGLKGNVEMNAIKKLQKVMK